MRAAARTGARPVRRCGDAHARLPRRARRLPGDAGRARVGAGDRKAGGAGRPALLVEGRRLVRRERLPRREVRLPADRAADHGAGRRLRRHRRARLLQPAARRRQGRARPPEHHRGRRHGDGERDVGRARGRLALLVRRPPPDGGGGGRRLDQPRLPRHRRGEPPRPASARLHAGARRRIPAGEVPARRHAPLGRDELRLRRHDRQLRRAGRDAGAPRLRAPDARRRRDPLAHFRLARQPLHADARLLRRARRRSRASARGSTADISAATTSSSACSSS